MAAGTVTHHRAWQEKYLPEALQSFEELQQLDAVKARRAVLLLHGGHASIYLACTNPITAHMPQGCVPNASLSNSVLQKLRAAQPLPQTTSGHMHTLCSVSRHISPRC